LTSSQSIKGTSHDILRKQGQNNDPDRDKKTKTQSQTINSVRITTKILTECQNPSDSWMGISIQAPWFSTMPYPHPQLEGIWNLAYSNTSQQVIEHGEDHTCNTCKTV
jgi:hypothetical protein